MESSFIKPFINSIQNVFGTMLQLPVQVDEPTSRSESTSSFDVSGIIGLSGNVTGSVVLSLPLETARRIVSLFVGKECEPGDGDFSDAIGELINIVAGNAKAGFDVADVSLSCPCVVIGPKHYISRPSGVGCILIPCQTDCGSLNLEIAIQERQVPAGRNCADAA